MNYELKRCKECGELFMPKSARQQYCKKIHYRPCPVCGKLVIAKHLGDPPRTCSKECTQALKLQTCLDKYGCQDPGNRPEAKEKRKQTCIQRYGIENPSLDPNISNKIKQTFLEKYGVTNISQLQSTKEKTSETWRTMDPAKRQDIVNQRKQTCLEKYGVDNPRKSEEVKQKTKKTLMETYGVDCSLQIPEAKKKSIDTMLSRYGTTKIWTIKEIRNKYSKTCMVRYGVPYYQKSEEFKKKVSETHMKTHGCSWPGKSQVTIDKRVSTNLKKYGVPAAFMLPEHQDKLVEGMKNSKHSRISEMNREFYKQLVKLGLDCELEFKIENYWYDICIPSYKLVIEIDPTISHSTHATIYNPVDKDYHRNKSYVAAKHGYCCIHIFDWDDKDKIIDMIIPKHEIDVTDCYVSVISDEDANQFIRWNDVHSPYNNNLINIGLINKNDNTLVQIAAFSNPRYDKKYQFELTSLTTERGYSIHNGYNKLFEYFIDNIDPDSVITYCDLAKSDGHPFEDIGFQKLRINQPTKWWSKSSRLISNSLLKRQGYDKIFNKPADKFDKRTDEQKMIENWWLPIYDCGHSVYIWKKRG